MVQIQLKDKENQKQRGYLEKATVRTSKVKGGGGGGGLFLCRCLAAPVRERAFPKVFFTDSLGGFVAKQPTLASS